MNYFEGGNFLLFNLEYNSGRTKNMTIPSSRYPNGSRASGTISSGDIKYKIPITIAAIK